MPVLSETNDLWSHISWCPASVVQIFSLVDVGSQAEISNDRLKGVMASKHDVLRFKIAVHDPILMHFCQTRHQTIHAFLYLSGSENSIAFLQSTKQNPACQKFQDHIDGVVGLEHSF